MGKRGEHGRMWWPEARFGCNSRGLVQGIGRGQGVTTARTIGAVLRASTGAHVVCSDLRSVGRALHGARRWPARDFSSDSRSPADPTTARHFSSDSASLTVDIMRRQFAVSLLRRGQCAGPYLSAQIQRGNVEAWTPRALRMSKSACAQCSACFVTHARHAMAMLFC